MKKKLFFSVCLMIFSYSAWATTWDTPDTISSLGEGADFSQIAINDDLEGLAVWVFSSNGSNSITQGNNLSSGTWGTVEDLSNTTNFADEPDVAINGSGVGVAAWVEEIDSDYYIRTSVFNGSSWQTPATISLGNSGSAPKVSVNSSGNAIVVWNGSIGGTSVTRASVYLLGAWSLPTTLSTFETSGDAQVAYSDAGSALAVWSAFDETSNVIRSSTFNGLLWSSPETISEEEQTANNPQIAINGDGDGIAVWEADTDNGTVAIRGATYTDTLLGGLWGFPQDISIVTNDSHSPQVVMNDSGNGVAVWDYFDGSNDRVRGSFFSSGSWSTPVTVSTSGEAAMPPQISMDSSNRAIAVWEANPPSSNPVIKSSTFSSGSWGSVQTLSNTSNICNDPQISMNDSSDAIAIWTCFDGTDYFVQTSQGDLS